MEGYGPDTYGNAFADVYDVWYGELGDAGAVVDAIATAAAPVDGGDPRAGRRYRSSGDARWPGAGFEVVGVDASAAMVEQLVDKPGGAEIETHLVGHE